jgi:tetratricopeptide (TPR) repeat protein
VALDHLHNLEFDASQRELEAWLSQHPTDLRALNYLAATILQREMFRRELLESQVYAEKGEAFRPGRVTLSPAFLEEFFGALDKAEKLAADRVKQNPNDEDALYWAGTTHATRAIFHLTLAKSHRAALGAAKEARKYHAQLLKINPHFVDAYLVIGTYDYVVGSLPWYLKVLVAVAGHHGDRERGLAAIKRVTEEGRWAREDAKSYLAVLYFREKRYAEALAILQGLAESYPRNFLLPQQIARIHKAQGDWQAAANAYDSLLAKHETRAPGYARLPIAKILYQAGEGRMRLGERDQALKRFEAAAKLPPNDIYVYRAELAAAGLYRQMNRPSDALRKYRRVADAIPQTAEGKAARQALKTLPADGEVRAAR